MHGFYYRWRCFDILVVSEGFYVDGIANDAKRDPISESLLF